MSTAVETITKEAVEIKDEVVAGEVDTTANSTRYLGYLGRIRPLLIASTRYLAYTSDLGEAFRPVVNPGFVKAAYGVSWLYLTGDVLVYINAATKENSAYEGYKANLKYKEAAPARALIPGDHPSQTTEVGLQVVKRAIFQATASMLLPALTIHSTVKYSQKYLFSKFKNARVRGTGPTALGLAVIPALPFMFDEPVEHVTDKAFGVLEEKLGITAGTHHVREDVPDDMKVKKEL